MNVPNSHPVILSALVSRTAMSTCMRLRSVGEVRSLLGDLSGESFLAMVAFHVGLPLRKGTSSGVASEKISLKLTAPLGNLTCFGSGLYCRFQTSPKVKAAAWNIRTKLHVIIICSL